MTSKTSKTYWTTAGSASVEAAATDDEDGGETLSVMVEHRRRPRARTAGGDRRRMLILCAVVVVSVAAGICICYGVVTLALRSRYATAGSPSLEQGTRDRRERRRLTAGAGRPRHGRGGGGGHRGHAPPLPPNRNMTCPDSAMIPPFDDMLWPHLYGSKLSDSNPAGAASRRPLAFLKPPKCPKSSPSESRQCRAANGRTLVAAVKTYGAGELSCRMLATTGLAGRPSLPSSMPPSSLRARPSLQAGSTL